MCKHRHKSHSMLKPFPDISFTRHSDLSVLERKKNCIKPCKIMTENQNVNKTTMKDVQQQHFLFKRASRMSKMFPKTLLSFVFVCSFFFKIGERVSKQDFRRNYPYFLPAATTTGYPIRPFSFHLRGH